MTTLGIDPGAVHVGWALFVDGDLHDQGQVCGDGKMPWRHRKPYMIRAIEQIIREKQPNLVAIEKTQRGGGRDRSPGQIASQADYTRDTEELAGEIGMMAVAVGAAVVRVAPLDGLRPLGLRTGASDRDVVNAFTRMFGLNRGKKLLVKDHHEARAAGVALHGEKLHLMAEHQRKAAS